MITVYFWDVQGIYSHSIEHDPQNPLPGRCTLKAPPVTTGTEVAAWAGRDWAVLAERPPAPGPHINQLRDDARQRVDAGYTLATDVLADGYPDRERESWPVQITEAQALALDPEAITPWIDVAAAARGLTREDLAGRIRALDAAYRVAHGTLSGTRQRLHDEIAAVIDDEHAAAALAAISWPESEDEPETT